MVTLVPERIEEYAVSHTTPLEPHLSELAQFTRENVDMAGMLCGPMEGNLLRFLVWASGARRIPRGRLLHRLQCSDDGRGAAGRWQDHHL